MKQCEGVASINNVTLNFREFLMIPRDVVHVEEGFKILLDVIYALAHVLFAYQVTNKQTRETSARRTCLDE